MNKEEFVKGIKYIQDAKSVECNAPLGIILKENYMHLDGNRFFKMCVWITKWYQVFGDKFPDVYWFERAKEATYKPIEEKTYVNKKHSKIDLDAAWEDARENLEKLGLNVNKLKR